MIGAVAFLGMIASAVGLGAVSKKSNHDYQKRIYDYNKARGRGTHAVQEFLYCCDAVNKLIESDPLFESKGGWDMTIEELHGFRNRHADEAMAKGRIAIMAEGYTPCLPSSVALYTKADSGIENGMKAVQHWNKNFGLNVSADRRGF